MNLTEANDLLRPGFLPLETGVQRLPDGTLVAAALHHLPGCTVEMVQWWLARRKTHDEFVRWHPT